MTEVNRERLEAALRKIANSREGVWNATTGDGHARCIEIAEAALAASVAGPDGTFKLEHSQVEHCVAQSTMAGRLSTLYLTDRLNDILKKEEL